MKKILLSALFLVALSGLAMAQGPHRPVHHHKVIHHHHRVVHHHPAHRPIHH